MFHSKQGSLHRCGATAYSRTTMATCGSLFIKGGFHLFSPLRPPPRKNASPINNHRGQCPCSRPRSVIRTANTLRDLAHTAVNEYPNISYTGNKKHGVCSRSGRFIFSWRRAQTPVLLVFFQIQRRQHISMGVLPVLL